jgi:hypothetical protein
MNHTYTRENHFKQFIKHIQIEIPDTIINQVKEDLIDKTDEINIIDVKQILKNRGEKYYFDHAQSVLDKITGKEILNISDDKKNQMINIYNKYNVIFIRDNKNTYGLHYPFIILKIAQYLKYYDVVNVMKQHQLKNPFKLQMMENKWINIIEEIDRDR